MTRVIGLAIVVGVLVYLLRRRLAVALKAAALAYLGITVVRLVQAQDGSATALELLLALSPFAVVWLGLWLGARWMERRKARPPAVPGEDRRSAGT